MTFCSKVNLCCALRRGLVALFLVLTLHAHGQFNGPGQVPGEEINRPQTATTDQSLLYPATHDLLIGPQDLVTVRVFGQDDYVPTVRVGNDGAVPLPLIGKVTLGGLSIASAEQLIASKLQAAGMYDKPQVTVTITDGPNASVTIVGETHAVLPVFGTRRLYDVIAAGGGFPNTASHVIVINRPGVPEPIIVDLGSDPSRSSLANIPVFAGDTIVVSRAGVVYVVGAFHINGIIPLNQSTPLTLIEATALSGGTAFEAKNSDMRIIRTVGTQRTVEKVDIKDVLYGRVPDPVLAPNDILFLPPSPIKSVITNGTLATFLGLAGFAISLGFR